MYVKYAGILLGLALGCASALAQNFPSKPIRIETGSVGSNGDLESRILANVINPAVGQPVVVENKTSGTILGETVARAAPDGYTLLVTGASFWLAPYLESDLPWDPVRDFLPVSLLSTSPNLVVVHPSVPVKNLKELIAYAKAHPGQLNYGSGGTGSTPHLAGELFNVLADTNIVRVPYKGVGEAMKDLVAGHVQVMFTSAGGASEFIKSGRMHALAVTSAKPSALFPDLPTATAAGLPGYEAEVLNGLFAPAKTPQAVIGRVNQIMVTALQRPDVKDKLFNSGMEVIAGGPDQLDAAMKHEMSVWGKLIKDRGIRAD